MDKIAIALFGYHDLTHSEYLELSHLVFVVLPPEKATEMGIRKSYDEAIVLQDKYVEIFRRNPALLKTEKLNEALAKIRRKMIFFKGLLKETIADKTGKQLDDAKTIESIAHPYLTNLHRDTQSALIVNAMEMTDALLTPANLSILTQFQLKETVDGIATSAHEADEILLARGEEKAYRKVLGNVTDTRIKHEKKLRFLLYTAIPAHYAEAGGTQAALFEHVIIDLNGVLDSFRHLTSGQKGKWAEDGNYDGAGDPGQPDTQPANPPNPPSGGGGGGGFTDPDA
ncbi:MAG: hypothetical protein LBU44_09370 [Mediterranea sp.]|jgi:hypothetical protein|nr:hypothetical protein [Mediterranea sp.]